MIITKAVDRFVWRFSKDTSYNKWKVNESDLEALNTIIDFVKNKHKQQLQANQLFAKLYVMVYAQFLQRYNATVFDDIPQVELHKLLDKPLSVFIQRFTDRLNDSELYSLLDELNIKHPSTTTKEEKDSETDRLSNAIQEQENKEKLFGDVWDLETVTDALERQINLVIDSFKDA